MWETGHRCGSEGRKKEGPLNGLMDPTSYTKSFVRANLTLEKWGQFTDGGFKETFQELIYFYYFHSYNKL